MKIACIGGGPAGLYLGILVKRSAPEHDVVVYERNRAADTFGFGVVFSDATLGHLAGADPETHGQITAQFARWSDIEIHAGGEVLRSTGHGFCGIERKSLLQILQARAKELGVRVEFEHDIKSLGEVAADVIVGCDGVAGWIRDALASELRPNVDVRANKFVWLGTTVPYQAFTFIFKATQHGLYRVHAYRYRDVGSTFIVECRPETWRAAGFEHADEDRTIALLGDIFAAELAGHPLIKNRSIWRNFPTVRCAKWHAGNVVLVGDAAHTAHFSIGSGTKLAMEDVIVLRDELLATKDIEAALAAYEARRRPEVEALQAAAQASLEWFEGTERYMAMTPTQMTYSLMTRSLRVSHASVAKRDPELARGVEAMLAAQAGTSPTRPIALPFTVGDRRARSRIAVAAEVAAPTIESSGSAGARSDAQRRGDAIDDTLVALGAAAATAGIVVTAPRPVAELATDDAAVAWKRVVEFVHGKGALIAARLVVGPELESAVERAAFADFDLLVLVPRAGDDAAVEQLPAAIQAARLRWRQGGWLAAAVLDRPRTRAAIVGHAAQLVRAGADLLWVLSREAEAESETRARLPAAPLADRLRNELGVPTAVDGAGAQAPDLDAAVAAGRADIVVVSRMPAGAPSS